MDTSAWHHSTDESVKERWLELLAQDLVGLCPQVRLEVLYSARSAQDYEALGEELDGLRAIVADGTTYARALDVQRELSQVGGLYHRSVKIADLLIAASAEQDGSTVLHYDADYDRIATVTGQSTEWIAERGSL